MAAGPAVTRGGGRRRAARKGDLTEQAILDTLERLLAERKLSAITIEDLAAGAGISRPTFYFYFDSREAALMAITELVNIELAKASDAWWRRSDESPEQAARRSVTRILEIWREHGPVLRAALEARADDPRMAEMAERVGKQFVDNTAEQIERDRDSGIAPPGPPSARALANVLVAMNERVCYDASPRLGKSPAADRRIAETLTTVWVRSVYGGQ